MPDRRFVVGRGFNMGDDKMAIPGDDIDAASWPNLYALLSSGYLYEYVPSEGYGKLPPHVFNAVRTRQEALGIIKVGQEPAVTVEWEMPPQVKDVVVEQEKQKAFDKITAEANEEAQAQAQEKIEAEAQKSTDEIVGEGTKSEEDPAKAEAQAAGEGDSGDRGDTDYNSWSKDDLVNEARNRGQSTSGSKEELAGRLKESDTKGK